MRRESQCHNLVVCCHVHIFRDDNPVPVGQSDYQLYSLGTPNGNKAGIIFEELGLKYDAHVINIGQGDQFSKGFVEINPNSKIPCALDKSVPGEPINLFESGSIMMYLAEKHQRFISTDPRERAQCINWLYWSQVQVWQGMKQMRPLAISLIKIRW